MYYLFSSNYSNSIKRYGFILLFLSLMMFLSGCGLFGTGNTPFLSSVIEPLPTEPPNANGFFYIEPDEVKSIEYSTENAFLRNPYPNISNPINLKLYFVSNQRNYIPTIGMFSAGNSPLFSVTLGDTDGVIGGVYHVHSDEDESKLKDGEVDYFTDLEIPILQEGDGVILKDGTIEITTDESGVYMIEYKLKAEWSRYDPANHDIERKDIEILGKFNGTITTLE